MQCKQPLAFVVFTFVIEITHAARILLIPFDHKGHVNLFGVTARALQDKGHEVVLLTQERHRPLLDKMDIPIIYNPTKASLSPTENYEKLSDAFFSSGYSSAFKTINFALSLAKSIIAYCYEVMGNEEIMERIEKHQFDIALVDGIDAGRCLYIIPYKFGIPYITLTARHDPWVAHVPAMPSVEGFWGFVQFTEHPSFFERFANFALYTFVYVVSPPPIFKTEQIAELAPERPFTTYHDLFRNSMSPIT